MSRVPSLSLKKLCRTAMLTVLPIALTAPALAQNVVSPPAPPPPVPAPVVTNTSNLMNVGDGGCVQQYDEQIFTLDTSALALDTAGLAAASTAAIASGVGLVAEEAASIAAAASFTVMASEFVKDVPPLGSSAGGAIPAGALAGSSTVEAIALGAAITANVAEVAGIATEAAAVGVNSASLALSRYTESLPECETTFSGTVTVQDGGVNATGNSYFKGDVGIDGNLEVSGDIDANQLHTAQGISAHGGAIWIGNPDGVSYQEGITLGGGALSGAGTGGALASTGHVSAIAIGNGANASKEKSLALGDGATASAVGATAIGENSLASGEGSIAIGNAMSTGTNTIAIGTGAVATASVAMGAGAMASGGGTAIGDLALANTGVRGSAFGNGAQALGDQSTAVGTNAVAAFSNSAAFGNNATATRANQQVFGTQTNTYTMPGITSDASKRAQTGLLEVTTTDAAGNLASDGGDIFNALARVQAGVAVAMAIETPELATGENFGIRMGWGGFDSFDSNANALGVSAIGVLGRNVFSQGDRLAVDVGAGWGWSEFYDYKQNNVIAGRAGMQLTW